MDLEPRQGNFFSFAIIATLMANREQEPQQDRETYSQSLIKSTLKDAMPEDLSSRLVALGIAVSDKDAIGVLSGEIIGLILQGQGDKKRKREITRFIENDFTNPKWVPSLQVNLGTIEKPVKAEVTFIDEKLFIHRSDIKRAEIPTRASTYEAYLQEQNELAKTKGKTKEKEPLPPVLHLTVNDMPSAETEITTQSLDFRNMSDRNELFLYDPGVLEGLLSFGLEEKYLQEFLDSGMKRIISLGEKIDAYAHEATEKLLQRRRIDPDLTLYVPQYASAAFMQAFDTQYPGQVQTEYVRLEKDEKTLKYCPYPTVNLNRFSARYSKLTMESYAKHIEQDPSTTTQAFSSLLKDSNGQELLKTLVRDKKVTYNNVELTLQEVDQKILPYVIPNDILLATLWYEVIQAFYGTKFTEDRVKNERKEISQQVIAFLFSRNQIIDILTRPPEYTVEEELLSVELETKRDSLIKRIGLSSNPEEQFYLQQELAKLNQEIKQFLPEKRITPRGKIEIALSKFIPPKKPDLRKDPEGYKRYLAHTELRYTMPAYGTVFEEAEKKQQQQANKDKKSKKASSTNKRNQKPKPNPLL